ncbi:hypothetical protein EDB95_0920 [Dinghuibacter silviterrae]|uniref:Uncharacterized protein n=2 Tax=Dinghuibacter silviterrae TaxID=1539049 RepID=A0A4R8DQ60_9BACT|nr:hypothetical protein EDB95_0920 [Dinghuibacter silviterrae]
MVNGYLVFDGSKDGDRQVDPQIAVGNGYILHGTNGGLIIYNKKGEYIDGVPQRDFADGIDPKLFYDSYNKVFGFDMWVYWDSAKIRPVNISVSETGDPRGAWNIYSVSASKGEDGGGIGYSHHWISYCFPGGPENTFVLSIADAKAGKSTKVYHFPGSLGEPVQMQGGSDDMYFFEIADKNFVIRKLTTLPDGTPVAVVVAHTPHHLANYDYPPESPQKDTNQTISSGDRNPKNVVYQNGYIWFSQAINYNGHSAVQWHQVDAGSGKIVQTGLIASPTSNYIQTTLAVNKHNDVLIGFQETNAQMYISPRFAYRYGHDKPGTIRGIISIGEGVAPTGGPAWGDYSGSVVDPDNMTDMWTIQSVAGKRGNGETVIARFIPAPAAATPAK